MNGKGRGKNYVPIGFIYWHAVGAISKGLVKSRRMLQSPRSINHVLLYLSVTRVTKI